MDYRKMIKERTCFASLYLLGPLVTDIAPDMTNITGTIGDADFLCMVYPAEHLALPDIDDIVEGTQVAKMVAHVGGLQ